MVELNNLLLCILHFFFFTVGVIPKALADKIVAAFVRRTVLVLASATWILDCLTLYSIAPFFYSDLMCRFYLYTANKITTLVTEQIYSPQPQNTFDCVNENGIN